MSDSPTPSAVNDSEAIAKFLSFLSHDLRGGLNGAVLMLEVVRRQLVKDENQAETVGDLDMVRHSILETVALMDRFVFAERLRIGRVPVNIGGVDLSSLMEQLAKEYAPAAQERGSVLQLEIDPRLSVQTDQNLLRRLLGNLIDNAIKFSRRQPVQIRAISGAAATSANSARIEIIDRGAGMAAEKIEQLNAPLDVTETYGKKGAGMGLYLARRIAKLLGATLRIEPATSQGTTVVLELPQLSAATVR